MLTLYHSPYSTCSQKVRLCLAEKGVAWESHIVDLKKREQLEPWYLSMNPNGVVPTLMHDDKVVIDSSVICEYIEEVFPSPPLSPADPHGRACMRAWMRYIEEKPTTAIRVPSLHLLSHSAGFEHLSVAGKDGWDRYADQHPYHRNLYRRLGAAGFDPALVRESLETLDRMISRVDSAVADGRWLVPDSFSIADIILIPTIVRMQDLGLHEHWANRPAFASWIDRAQARPSFAAAYPPGSRVYIDR